MYRCFFQLGIRRAIGVMSWKTKVTMTRQLHVISTRISFAVKVDRETNPEVDEIHLLAVQLMGGSGGWPLHVLLTPDREPFLGMTYLPQDEFVQILERVHEIWNLDRETIDAVAAEVAQGLESYIALPAMPVDIGKEQIESVIAGLIEDRSGKG